jgi:hypothetical protein
MHPLIWFIALFYLGIISIETVMIVRNKDETVFDVIIRTANGIAKYITIKTNKDV